MHVIIHMCISCVKAYVQDVKESKTEEVKMVKKDQINNNISVQAALSFPHEGNPGLSCVCTARHIPVTLGTQPLKGKTSFQGEKTGSC